MRIIGSPMLRFIARVDGHGNDCWLWTGGANNEGYGRFSVTERRRVAAHRWLYEQVVGPIPDGLVLDHLCRNRLCVNPLHLEVVTHRENILRGVGMGAQWARRTHCKRGHQFTPENILQYGPEGRWRVCRACRRENLARSRGKKVAS